MFRKSTLSFWSIENIHTSVARLCSCCGFITVLLKGTKRTSEKSHAFAPRDDIVLQFLQVVFLNVFT